jgi:methyl-accepting chemotaxis protein
MNKIAEGIKAMDDMSSQTHTLVHKVAEGAVRVIEQGNSFDAVAKKVRNLSQKSMAAVKNTKSSTEYCITKSDEAVNNANKYEHYKENTEKIVMGINDIETIAYQTNLLALNAEEEAARSSDNGEKFAAVTEEVSSLAKKTTDAAKDITTLIGECIKKAGNGIRVANKCKDSTENIVMDVKKASILAKEITEASKEQSEGINQVGKAIQQIDVVTQQNAANAEETASASEELAEQALTMKEQIEILSTQVSDKTTEDEASNQAPEQPSRDEKTLEKAATKLLSPIAKLLKPVLIRLHNLESDHPNKGIISESMGSSESTPDVDNKAEGGNGNKEDVLVETASNESIIPMDENRIPEHKEGFSDF